MSDKKFKARLDAARDIVYWACKQDWTMHIPPRDTDSDVFLCDTFDLIEQALAEKDAEIKELVDALDVCVPNCTYGFEGPDTFNECGKCLHCKVLAKHKGARGE